jgi:hypothetical protein
MQERSGECKGGGGMQGRKGDPREKQQAARIRKKPDEGKMRNINDGRRGWK